MSDIYYKVPIYDGLYDIIESVTNKEPKYYKYYKRGKYKPTIICGFKEYKRVNKLIEEIYGKS